VPRAPHSVSSTRLLHPAAASILDETLGAKAGFSHLRSPLQRLQLAKLAARMRTNVLPWLLLSLAPTSLPAQSVHSGMAPFILDGNRIYASVEFLLPNRKLRKVLVFVDLGSPAMILSKELYKTLKVDANRELSLQIGDMAVSVKPGEVSKDSWFPFSIGENRKVEALLPAGILQNYQVRFDYAARTMTLAEPKTLELHGNPVPLKLDPKTGLIAVEARIDGKSYPMTIDNGSGFSWIRKSAANGWISRHPDWQRGIGAVGPSNMRMADDGIESSGVLLRMAEVRLGSMHLKDVGALAIGPDNGGHDFMDWYSRKNALPVIGWLGGNVLSHFRITIDYPNKISYWEPQSAIDPHDLDYVGLTLVFRQGAYFVGGIATRNGQPTVSGAQIGDKVVQIGTLWTDGASREAIFAAMHGKAVEMRSLVIERGAGSMQLQAPVTAF
jgi:hypothetical protein